ncbi:10326_t:CDS:10 [Paraglomus occultum]|uniref:10326_t:CDS:1 n=1 Tax=Paraglomus occultum TaxID=144539 RepID=A0A9N8Z9A4_9GLOM|nr:10326_t:CDS:10 [Paraglomus occultum]
MADALHLPFEFDDNDGLGPWDVMLSEGAIRDIRKLKSSTVINAVVKKLGQISSGAWDKRGLRRISSLHTTNPVYEIVINNDGLKILWQVDCDFSTRSHTITQLVKIWAISADDEIIKKTLDSLAILHLVYTAEHNRLCVVRQAINGIISPCIIEGNDRTKSVTDIPYGSPISGENLLEVHKMLVTNKFVPLSKSLFKSLITGGAEFTFQVSKTEYEIIQNRTSTIIIGRSGTGKTTCIVFRLVSSCLPDYPSNLDNEKSPRKNQIFITLSSNLCLRVKNYFKRLKDSVELAGRELSESQFAEFIKKKEDGIDVITNDTKHKDEDIPKSFRQLTGDHFPLFMTYDTFAQMLQATYGIDFQESITGLELEEDDDEFCRGSSFTRKSKAAWVHHVDFKLFQKKYWPHFSTHELDCWMVFSEISVIKGTNPEGVFLSREDYRNISTKKYPAFRYNRDSVYDLFEQYEKIKTRFHDYDSIDRTIAVLRRAKMEQLGCFPVHELYIDECQDNSIVDFALILKLFHRAESVFVAGDIAQCIAQGSSFRFQDISALLYQWEIDRREEHREPYNVAKPKQFELNINYRSHDGILQLASSIIDLIWHFFPDSIDRLPRERGEVGGPLPHFFSGFQETPFILSIFSNKEGEENKIEFGAEQVILVRNEIVKRKLEKLVGDRGIIMTIFESKGMEFNDVLLYNFFTDSPAGLKWRLILAAFDNSAKGIPAYVHEKHYILSSELKHLYVAITRARQRIWICDANADKSKPMQEYWERLGLINRVQQMDKIDLQVLARQSDDIEWNRKGDEFFEQKKFVQAAFCYEKGKNKKGQKLANAHNLWQEARELARTSINDSNEDTVRERFKSAADAFNKCDKPTEEASCYEDFEMFKEAGDVYARNNMNCLAANRYYQANMWDEAGNHFEKANKYIRAADAYENSRNYYAIFEMTRKHKADLDKKTLNGFIARVYKHYRHKETDTAEKALAIITTVDERINFLKEYIPEDLLDFYIREKLFHRAAEHQYASGKLKEASDYFIKAENDNDNIEALHCILHLCSINVLRETMTDNASSNTRQELSNLLGKTKFIIALESPSSKTSPHWANLLEQVRLYSAYLDQDLSKIYDCIQFFKARENCATEFCAISMWLIIPHDNIQAEYWRTRLQFLLRLYSLAIDFTNSVTQRKDCTIFEDVFAVSKPKDRPLKRQILCQNLLVDRLHAKQNETLGDWRIYRKNDIDRAIAQSLVNYVYELIGRAGDKGSEISITGPYICYKSYLNPDRETHRVKPGQSVLEERLKLSYSQYTVTRRLRDLRKLDRVTYNYELLDEQQTRWPYYPKWWAERLAKLHVRLQSPQTGYPMVIQKIVDGQPDYIRKDIIDLVYDKWLWRKHEFKINDFASMLKYVFLYQQLRKKGDFDKFHLEMSKRKPPVSGNPPIGFVRYEDELITVGKLLSLVFLDLEHDEGILAIRHAKTFTRYAIDNADKVNLIMPDSLEDLVSLDHLMSLVELTAALLFASKPEYCDFYTTLGYLVNCYKKFNVNVLFPFQYTEQESVDEYYKEFEDLIDQAQRLLHRLFDMVQRYWPLISLPKITQVILRSIRLLALIAINESNLRGKVFDCFKHLSEHPHSVRYKDYLNERNVERLAHILCDDLNKTSSDSLVIVHYGTGYPSRHNNRGLNVIMLTYKTPEQFHSSLERIANGKQPVATCDQCLSHRRECTALANP